jgi:hypothetical protein
MSIVYPSEYQEEWYSTWSSMVNALDGHHFAAFEDRNLFYADGGDWTWDSASGVVTWSATLLINTPSTGKAQNLAASNAILAEGDMLVVDLSRGASNTVSLVSAADTTLDPDDAVLALCLRYNNKLYFRNGVVLASGGTFGVFSGGIGGARPLDTNDVYTATALQTVFTLSATPHAQCIPQVFRQGLLMNPGATNDYQISGTTVTFTYGVTLGQIVQVRHWI